MSHVRGKDKCDWKLSQNMRSDWKFSQNMKSDWKLSQNMKSDWNFLHNVEKKDKCGCELSQVRDIVKLFATLLSIGILYCDCKSQYYPKRRFAGRKKYGGA